MIVSLGRWKAMGESKRVAGLRDVFEHAGAEVTNIQLVVDHRRRGATWLSAPVWHVVRGRVVPEALIWDARTTVAALEASNADLVIVETIRAFHPAMLNSDWTVVLDYVDRLGVSYRDRSRSVAGPLRKAMFAILARSAARFERRVPMLGIPTFATGRGEAEELSCQWVPITQNLIDHTTVEHRADCVFFGNLSYPPNVTAVERLARIWPMVSAARPEATFLLAGSRMSDGQRSLARELGWRLAPNFDRLETMLAGVNIAVAPLKHASGIQIKVLEAAAAGLAQVISPATAKGLDENFPAFIARTDREFADEIISLIDDTDRRVRSGSAARAHIAGHYSVQRWASWASDFLGSLDDGIDAAT